ncbi:MAG: sortase, partial [Patescibacteria group bacterium]|nr:sortase [Patescibacteria group bacterium]
MKQKLWLVGKLILIAAGIFLAVYVFLNAPALWKKLSYWYITQFKNEAWPESYQVMPVDLKNNLGYILGPTRKASDINQDELRNELALSNNNLYIPKLGIRAPINWEISEADAIAKLQTGVVHLETTGIPGTDGNIFITGHSSYYWWDPGEYKTIFALLPNIANNDVIYITYNDQLYTYNVVETLTVNPADTYVMDKLDYPAVSLMTCVP